MTRRDVAHASLPVFAFAIPFAGYATGVLVEPSFGTLLPAPVLAGGLLVVFLLGFVVGTVGYLGGGALYWSHARLGDTLNAPDP